MKEAEDGIPASCFQSMVTKDFSFKNVFKKEIQITNNSGRTCHLTISPTKIKTIQSLDINKIGNVQFEHDGTVREQEMIILDKAIKTICLDTKNVYITIMIEIQPGVWRYCKKNRRVNSSRYDYNITPQSIQESFKMNTDNIYESHNTSYDYKMEESEESGCDTD